MMSKPLPFDFEGKGVILDLDLEFSFGYIVKKINIAGVAEVSGNSSSKWRRDASPTTTTTAIVGVESELQPMPPSLEIGCAVTGTATATTTDEWESVFATGGGVASPSQDQYWLMSGDVEDPTSINKVLQTNFEFNPNNATVFGNVVDQGFGADPDSICIPSNSFPSNTSCSPSYKAIGTQNLMFGSMPNNQMQQQSSLPFEFSEMKHPMIGPQMMINKHHVQHGQNPSFFLPLSYGQQEQNIAMPPQPKRHNPGPISIPSPVGGRVDIGRQQQQLQQQGLPQGQSFSQQQQQQQQAMIDQLYKAAELVQTGNLVLAQGILARLNQQLSPIGKPFHRAAFYFKEALQLLILHSNNNVNPITTIQSSSPFSLVFKIGAYKSLSDISPVIQFANFTCNQAMLEVLEGFDSIHVIDFDIGYGGQWASFMQELSLRTGGAPSLRITAFASPSTHDQLELGLVRENLILFASEINMVLEFDILNIDSLNSGSWSLQHHVSENEAIAVNLPVSSFSNCQLSLPLVLRFVKQLSPKVVVSVDRGCDRTDLPFPNHVIHALQSYSNLLESLDAVNVNPDALQKIERFLIQPGIEKIVMGRYVIPEKTQHWRTLFLSSGFSPLTFSNLTETQAECVVKRTPVRGFHVEKRQSSLVLCWQRKELISASAWRC